MSDDLWCILKYSEERGLQSTAGEILKIGKELSVKKCLRFCIVLLGNVEPALMESLAVSGVDEIYTLDAGELTCSSGEVYAQCLSNLIQISSPRLVLFGSTAQGSELSARVSAKLKAGLLPECLSIDLSDDGTMLAGKLMYGGRVHATVSVADGIQLATLKPGITEPSFERSDSKKARLTSVPARFELSECLSEYIGLIHADVLEAPLEESEIIVAGGRGIGSSENFELLKQVAITLGGTVAGSRIAIDNGWLSRDRQVGQTGKVVKPKLYLACGISGSPHHVLGMKDSETVVAINSDPNAPIFQIADVGVVGDFREVALALIEEITRRKAAC